VAVIDMKMSENDTLR